MISAYFYPIVFMLLSSISTFAQQNAAIVTHTRPNAPEHFEKPYVLLVSIDGFRYDYLKKYNAINMAEIANQGVQAQSLIPCFPSSTFPNHYSIVTGMYPARHGIVSNTFFIPPEMPKYRISDSKMVRNGQNYGGKPLWVYAEQAAMRTASLFWVGSEADIDSTRPAVFYRYDKGFSYKKRVAQVLDWLGEKPETRPHLITLYFSLVDTEGHGNGPGSDQVSKAVAEIDEIIGKLWKKIEKTGLPVNMILVSDHGMQRAAEEEPIYLEGLSDLSGYEIARSSGVINLLYPKANAVVNIDSTIAELRAQSKGKYEVFKSNEMPPHLHYKDNDRLGEIVVYANAPYVFGRPGWKPSKGIHGYDPFKTKNMHGIFYAIGPNFKHQVSLLSFENIHVFPAIMQILGLSYNENSIDGVITPLAPAIK